MNQTSTVAVASSDLITTLAEARAYYQSKLAGSHTITCRGQSVDIVFEADGTHLFSVKVDDIYAIPDAELVTRNVGGGKRECRQFSDDRARLMDCVLPAISLCTRCVIDKGPPSRANRKVFGQKMSCGRVMCVVLRLGAGKSLICITAYPVDQEAYRKASWQRPGKFPP